MIPSRRMVLHVLSCVLLIVTALALENHLQVGNSPAPGQMKPFGQQGQPLVPVPETTGTIPLDMFLHHINTATPFVMRQVHKSPAQNWTDDVLVSRFGEALVVVEPKREKHMYETPKYMSVSQWVHKYRNRSYIVSQMPTSMYGDFDLPGAFRCSPLKHLVIEAMLWLSSGNTSSAIHKDSPNTVNCQVLGSKDWILINHAHAKAIPLVYEGEDPYESLGGFSSVNVQAVDLDAYPALAFVPISKVTVHPGDCLYIPGSALHQVNSSPGTNMAFTALISGRTQLSSAPVFGTKRTKQCAAKDGVISLANISIFYEYNGTTRADLSTGMDDPYDVVDVLTEDTETDRITKKKFMSELLSVLKEATKRGLDDDHRFLKATYNRKQHIREAIQDAYTHFFVPLSRKDKRRSSQPFVDVATLRHAAIYKRDIMKRAFFKYFEVLQFHSLYDHAATRKYQREVVIPSTSEAESSARHDEL